MEKGPVRITKPGSYHNMVGELVDFINVRYKGGLVKVQKKNGPIVYELIPLDYLIPIGDQNEKSNP